MIRFWSITTRRSGIVACCLLIAGCSVPQAIDPRRLFADEPPAPETAGAAETRAQAEADAAAAGDEPYPVLSSVPDRPTPPTPREIRSRVLEGLVSDRGNARYTDEVVRARETPAEATPPALPSGSAAQPAAASATTGLAAGTKAPPQATAQPAPVQDVAKQELPAPPVEPTVQPAVAAAPPAPRAPALASRPESNPPPAAAPAPPQVAAVPPATRTPAAVEPLRSTGLETPLATIQFGHGSANLDGNDREILRQAAVLALQEGATVKVVGHSSGRGQGDSVRQQLGNLEMSIGRANAVAGALIQFGLDPGNVIVEAKSDQEPLYRETAATGEAGNRRAEVYLIR